MLQVLTEGKGPVSWLFITLRLVPVCHHVHVVSQHLMVGSIIHVYGRGTGALLTPWGWLRPSRFPGEGSPCKWSGKESEDLLMLVDQHRHWMHQAVYGAHKTATATHPRSLLLARMPGSPQPRLLVQQQLMRCGSFPYICS